MAKYLVKEELGGPRWEGGVFYPGGTIFNELPPVPVTAAKLGSTAPTLATFIGNIEQYTFDATNDYVIGATEIVHWYKEGTDIHPHMHWATNGLEEANKGVKWQLEYSIGNMDGTFSGATTISAETTILANTTDRTHMYTAFANISGTGVLIGSLIVFKLSRIAATGDAPAADPFGLGVGFHAEIDTIGSKEEITK